MPYCPRCGTALSSHELGQPDVYRDVEDESAYVALPLTDEGEAADRLRRPWAGTPCRGLSLVVWTTTPWTLLSNTGAAVGPDLDYAVVAGDGGIVAAESGAAPCPATGAVVGRGARRSPGATWSACATERPFTTWSRPRARRAGRLAGGGRRLRRGRRGDRDRPPGPGLRRGRPAGRTGERPAHPQPGRTRRALHHAVPLAGRPERPGHQHRGQRPAGGVGPVGAAASRTSTRTPTAGAAERPSSTGASPAGTSGPRSGRPSWWPRTRPSAGTPSTSATDGWGSGWPTTWTGPCPGTASGARRSPSGVAARATSAASGSLAELSDLAGRDVSDVDPHRRPSTR